MHVLPNDYRNLLKEQVGTLVDEKKLIDILKKEQYIISVGDMVTYTILKHEIEPVFCVVDYKTRRGRCSDEVIKTIKSYGKKSIVIENAAGTISDDLWNVIKFAYEDIDNTSLRIEIIGEEDLASLATIYLAPRDVTIIYGLPDKGVLVVKPTKGLKDKVKKVLDVM